MIFIVDLNHDLNRFKSLDLNQMHPCFRDVYPFNCLIIAMCVYRLGLYCVLFRNF